MNLQDWASANAAQSQDLANTLAGTAQQDAERASAGVDSLQDDFYERLRGGTVRYDGAPGTAAQAGVLAGQGYNGPDSVRDLPGYEGVMANAQRAQGNAMRLGDFYGRTTALQDLAGRRGGQYSATMQALDSALVGGAGAGASRFQELGKQWGGLMDRANTMESASQGLSQGARAESKSAQERYAADAARLGKEETAAAMAQTYATEASTQQDAWERKEEAERRRAMPNRPPPPKKDRGGAGLWEGWG